MGISSELLALEKENLFAAYQILRGQWIGGERERDLGLHLIFLAWYGIVEPPNITGFPETDEMRNDLMTTFSEVHAHFEPEVLDDAEMLYVVGLAADMFWFMFDDPEIWKQRGIDYKFDYRRLKPEGLDPSIFQNRGAYGEYYQGQATLEGGY